MQDSWAEEPDVGPSPEVVIFFLLVGCQPGAEGLDAIVSLPLLPRLLKWLPLAVFHCGTSFLRVIMQFSQSVALKVAVILEGPGQTPPPP